MFSADPQESRPLPPLAAHEVEVQVQATGLCGSDLHYYHHFRNGDMVVREPLTLGHESAGVVVACGSSVSGLAVGDRVALEVGLPCGACDLCRRRRYNICRDMRFRSSAKAFPHAQGTLQQRIVQPAEWCHKLPPDVPLQLGALAEPLAVAMHARDRAQLASGSTVLVFGAGAVGLLCAAMARVSGAAVVVVADIQQDRLRFALDHAFADAVVQVPLPTPPPASVADKLAAAQQVAELVREARVNGQPVGEVAATFECTGVESCLQASIYSTAPGGRIMIIGMGNPVQTLPISAAALREVDLVGVFRYAHVYPEVVRLLASQDPRLPDLAKLITHRFRGMEAIPRAFDMAGRVKDADGNLVLKVMVDM